MLGVPRPPPPLPALLALLWLLLVVWVLLLPPAAVRAMETVGAWGVAFEASAPADRRRLSIWEKGIEPEPEVGALVVE